MQSIVPCDQTPLTAVPYYDAACAISCPLSRSYDDHRNHHLGRILGDENPKRKRERGGRDDHVSFYVFDDGRLLCLSTRSLVRNIRLLRTVRCRRKIGEK